MADVEMLCCRKEDESLLQKFVPVNVFSTRSVRRMMSHDVRSGRFKTHECSQCDYQAQSRSALVTHSRTHTGEKPYQCELCQKKFNTKGNLDKHILTHKGIRRFSCDLCEYKATTKHLLLHSHILCDLLTSLFSSLIYLQHVYFVYNLYTI